MFIMRTTPNKSEAEPAPSKPANAKPPDIASAVGQNERGVVMEGFVQDIEGLAIKNGEFRRVLYTAKHCQIVVMALKPKEEIGAEVHKLDQFFRVEEAECIEGEFLTYCKRKWPIWRCSIHFHKPFSRSRHQVFPTFTRARRHGTSVLTTTAYKKDIT
jgi:hypothetical protein